MTVRTIWQKLKSTKLWCAVAGIAMGVCLALGGDASAIEITAGSVTSLVSLVAYIVTEGRVDAAAAKSAGSAK